MHFNLVQFNEKLVHSIAMITSRLMLFVIIISNFGILLATASSEPCPKDSIIHPASGQCKCSPERCITPTCLSELIVIRNSSDTAGECCPRYVCDKCPPASRLNGRCPCAPGAVLSVDYPNRCKCVAPEQSLHGSKCVCDPELCRLPELCDEQSIALQYFHDCCPRTKCVRCPDDSHPTNYRSMQVADKCICSKCSPPTCNPNQVPLITKRGKGFPGKCCHSYRCKDKLTIALPCVFINETFSNGQTWITTDHHHQCVCKDGVAICSPKARFCHYGSNIYEDGEFWTLLDDCTGCICDNGVPRCISHWCNIVSDTGFGDNTDDKMKNACRQHSTNTTTVQCEKLCPFGYITNGNGCKTCECASSQPRLSNEVLKKYNMTHREFVHILDNYRKYLKSTGAYQDVNGTQSNKNETYPSGTESVSGKTLNWIYVMVVIIFFVVFLGVFISYRNYTKTIIYSPVKLKLKHQAPSFI